MDENDLQEIAKDFLIEAYELLNAFDNDLIELEKGSADPDLLARIFRGIHTIKGTSGFLSFDKLVSISHVGESLLDLLRKGQLAPSREITSALLALGDAVRQILANIETEGSEGDTDYSALLATLKRLQDPSAEPAPQEAAPPEPVAAPTPEPEDEADDMASVPAHRQTLAALEELYRQSGQPVELAALAEARGLAEGTVRNHLTKLKREGVAEAHDDGTYEPLTVEAPAAATPAPDVAPAVAEAPPAAPVAAPSAPAEAAATAEEAVATEEAATTRKSTVVDNTIRVDVELLDKLMNLVGELVLTRNQVLQHSGSTGDGALAASVQHLNLITTELQEGVMKTRMQPIGNVWNKFPRVVRDIAVTCQKKARVEMEGADTELDKTIIEAIKDPLTHLVRNAVDHGLEAPAKREAAGKPAEGRLLLRAFHEGGQVNIEITDDGGGIDPKKIAAKGIERGLITQSDAARMSDREVLGLIFAPGFSTAEKVSNISGRGVGMDVVKTNIEKIGGTVDVHSKLGEGTTFRIKIPLTLAIIPALMVRMRDERFAIPQVNLLELVRLEGAQIEQEIETIYNAPVYRLRGKLLPLLHLSSELGLSETGEASREAVYIVVLQADDQNFGLVVDEVIDTEEVVVKPLSKQLKYLSAYAGATIMGDGRVALILDVLGLAQGAHVLSEEAKAQARAAEKAQQAAADLQRLLLIRAATDRRLAVPLDSVSRLEEIPHQQVERAGNRELVQYRGHLMPLVRLAGVLGGGGGYGGEEPELLQVVVCGQDGSAVGLVVDEVMDIVEERVATEQQGAQGQGGISGVAVVQNRITELLDVDALTGSAGHGASGMYY